MPKSTKAGAKMQATQVKARTYVLYMQDDTSTTDVREFTSSEPLKDFEQLKSSVSSGTALAVGFRPKGTPPPHVAREEWKERNLVGGVDITTGKRKDKKTLKKTARFFVY